MTTIENVFPGIVEYASRSTVREWEVRLADLGERASRLLAGIAGSAAYYQPHPWVCSADARHFWEFAEPDDIRFMLSLSEEEHNFLFRGWTEEEWSLGGVR